MQGFIIAPAYMKVGYSKKQISDTDDDAARGSFKGLAISAFNQVKGNQKGVTIGAVNYTHTIKGIQLGIINIIQENPKGLRVLPIFNTRFGKRKTLVE
jgi:hypothetical protein